MSWREMTIILILI